jgi:ABC-type sugar transport system ATPase subunit
MSTDALVARGPEPRTGRLEVRDLVKTFPGVRALDRVSLIVAAGEIHALHGENGAGKSTLGKIVGGVYVPDSGELIVDGVAVSVPDEASAGALGIGIVHQEGSLVPHLSIAENVFAGRQPTRLLGMIDRRTMRERTRRILDELGVALDPDVAVARCSAAQAQVVEIAKALSRDLRILILDEPTAALTLTETQRLFAVCRKLAANGVAIVYVSHRLAEIFELCDRVTVLKDGEVMGDLAVADTTQDELIRLMVGRDVYLARDAAARTVGAVRLEVSDLASRPLVRNASFRVHGGEIVCLAGLVGSGRSETCEAIFGVRRVERGEIRLGGRTVRFRGPWDAIAAGIGMVPEDRKDGGLFLGMDIAANVSAAALDKVSRAGHVSETRSVALADRFIRDLRIATPSARRMVGNLSGGNQQKVLLAKWLALEPDVLIIDEPTRGVDVGARAEISRILRNLAARGMALLVVSSDLPEVLTLADRIVVMADGRTVGELDGSTADEQAILRLATRYTSLDAPASMVVG